jgi:hypothetical protein
MSYFATAMNRSPGASQSLAIPIGFGNAFVTVYVKLLQMLAENFVRQVTTLSMVQGFRSDVYQLWGIPNQQMAGEKGGIDTQRRYQYPAASDSACIDFGNVHLMDMQKSKLKTHSPQTILL